MKYNIPSTILKMEIFNNTYQYNFVLIWNTDNRQNNKMYWMRWSASVS